MTKEQLEALIKEVEETLCANCARGDGCDCHCKDDILDLLKAKLSWL